MKKALYLLFCFLAVCITMLGCQNIETPAVSSTLPPEISYSDIDVSKAKELFQVDVYYTDYYSGEVVEGQWIGYQIQVPASAIIHVDVTPKTLGLQCKDVQLEVELTNLVTISTDGRSPSLYDCEGKSILITIDSTGSGSGQIQSEARTLATGTVSTLSSAFSPPNVGVTIVDALGGVSE